MTLNEIMPQFLSGVKIRRKSWHENLWIEARPDLEQVRLFVNEENGKYYVYLGITREKLPQAEYFADHVLSLPMFNGMNTQEIAYVIKIVKEFE